MAQKTARVTARVPEDLLRHLEHIMDIENIDSLSEGLRICIEEYITLKTSLESSEKIAIDIGRAILEDIDFLVHLGRVSSREEAFRYAIKTWTEEHFEKYVTKAAKLEKAAQETQARTLERRGQKQLTSYYQKP